MSGFDENSKMNSNAFENGFGKALK